MVVGVSVTDSWFPAVKVELSHSTETALSALWPSSGNVGQPLTSGGLCSYVHYAIYSLLPHPEEGGPILL